MTAEDPSPNDDEDRALLQRIAAGGKDGEAAFNSLYRKYRKPLIAFLIRHGVDSGIAEDLVQEAFIKIVRAASGFRQDSRVSTWIYEIVKNLLLDHLRKKRPDILDDDAWGEVDRDRAEEKFRDDEAADNALAAKKCVERQYREFRAKFPACADALDRVVRDEWLDKDLAKFLGRTEGATREFLRQCRKKLRPFLEPCREFLGGAR
jgi:RNA polymerase sigma-70 factor (ECF subfamily)